MRWLALLLLVACKDEPQAQMRASCRPNSALDGLECVVENVGKKRSRACMTAREQPPKGQPLIARRVCTAPLDPGKSIAITPKFDVPSLQPACSPDGTWVCKDDIVESPAQLTENIADQR